jgi:hypothetical protein
MKFDIAELGFYRFDNIAAAGRKIRAAYQKLPVN